MISLMQWLRNSEVISSVCRTGGKIGSKKQAAILLNLLSTEIIISSSSDKAMWSNSSVNLDGIESMLLFSKKMVLMKFINCGSKIKKLLNIVIWISMVSKQCYWTGMIRISAKWYSIKHLISFLAKTSTLLKEWWTKRYLSELCLRW